MGELPGFISPHIYHTMQIENYPLSQNLAQFVQQYPLKVSLLTFAGYRWEIVAVANQNILLDSVQTEEDLANFPFGLLLWASAIGLAQWLAKHSEIVLGKPCLELGAGVGVAGLVAHQIGGIVTQTDYQESTLVLCRENARRNAVQTTICAADWRDFPTNLLGFPVVIASDILYERTLHPVLEALLPRVVAPEGVLILSDPWRPQAIEFLERIEASGVWELAFDEEQVLWEGQQREIVIVRATRKFP